MAQRTVPRPFLKWVGGKTQLVGELTKCLPAEFAHYHEPFLGGGAFFFALYRQNNITQTAYLSDLNAELIDTYTAIRDDYLGVIEELSQYPHNKNFYYSLRERDPDTMSKRERAARMIYLNKTGYNGLYRVNKSGKFNVPFGKYKNPKYLDRDNLEAVSKALKRANLQRRSFESVLDVVQAGDLVYLDPPYVPVSQTANFTSYHSSGFTLEDQRKLKDICEQLTKVNVYVMLSNSDTFVVRDLFGSNTFEIHEVFAKRAINSNGKKRGKVKELIVTNYSVQPLLQETQLPLPIQSTSLAGATP